GLELFDDLLARQQLALLPVEFVDFLDLGIDLGDLAPQVVVAVVLVADPAVVPADDQERRQQARHHRQGEHPQEVLLAQLAALLAPWEQIDPGHQSKLLSASPQAIIRAGASCASACACTRGPRVMFARGLAIAVGTPSCSSTMLAMPGIEAQPPASTTWSTRLNSLPA